MKEINIEKSVIKYVINGKEHEVIINRLNKLLVLDKIYRNREKISVLKFVNYDFTNESSIYSIDKFKSLAIELIFENCVFDNINFYNIKSLKILNSKFLKSKEQLHINEVLEVEINNLDLLEDSSYLFDIANVFSLKLNNIKKSKFSIYLKNVDKAFFDNVKTPTLEVIEVNKLFLNMSTINVFIRDDDKFEVLNALNLVDSSINFYNYIVSIITKRVNLKNSYITCDKKFRIYNLSQIRFKDEFNDFILDTSSYISANEFLIDDTLVFRNDEIEIFDKKRFIDSFWNFMYIKDGVTYKTFITEEDIYEEHINHNILTIKTYDDELIEICNLEFLYFKNMFFEFNKKFILNDNQILILENCDMNGFENVIEGGNVELINENDIRLNIYLKKCLDVDVIVSKYSDYINNIVLTDVENFDLLIDSNKIISLSEVLDCNLFLNSNSKLDLKNVSCNEMILSDIKLLIDKNNSLKIKRLKLTNSNLIFKYNAFLEYLEYLYINNSSIHGDKALYLPNLFVIKTNTSNSSISSLSSNKLIVLGENKYISKENGSTVKVNIIEKNKDDINYIRLSFINELKNIRDKISEPIKSYQDEEKQILDDIDWLKQVLLDELKKEYKLKKIIR